jgi:hypothetical protein
MQKVLKTSADVASAQAKQLGEDGATGISMVADGSGARFAGLDSEKYGKVSLLQSQNTINYSQGMTISGKSILSDRAQMDECIAIDRLLNGGFIASLDIASLTPSEIVSALDIAVELPFFRPRIALGICGTCGRRLSSASDRCDFCKSPQKLQVYS